MKKPFVAIIGSFSEIVPGHVYLQDLIDYVKQGVIEAGGVPEQLEMIAVCDGLCQDHKGMCYPLTGRGLIADSVEMVVDTRHFDAMVLLPSCDKIIPGMLMAAARLDIPAIIVPGGSMLSGNSGESTLSMCILPEVLDMSLPGAGTAAAVSNKRKYIAKASGRYVMKLLEAGLTPRRILTRETLLNGITGAITAGSSTNLILHILMAIANEAGVELSLDDFRYNMQSPKVGTLTFHQTCL